MIARQSHPEMGKGNGLRTEPNDTSNSLTRNESYACASTDLIGRSDLTDEHPRELDLRTIVIVRSWHETAHIFASDSSLAGLRLLAAVAPASCTRASRADFTAM